MTKLDVALQPAAQLVSVHARHHDVGNDEVHLLGLHRPERFLAVGGRQDAVFRLQLAPDQSQQVLVVVHQQQRIGSPGRSRRARFALLCRGCRLRSGSLAPDFRTGKRGGCLILLCRGD